jgi:hypothetical protein
MSNERDERLEQLRRVLNLAHDRREKANRSFLKRLIFRLQPPKEDRADEVRKPKDAA